MVARDLRHVWHPFTAHSAWPNDEPLVIERAEGMHLFDTDGNRYLDGVSSLWLSVHGHGVPEIDAKHLLKDRVAVFIHRTFVFWALLGLVIPYLIDGWRGVLWGGLVRVFITHHLTWSVNSVCHQFGFRSFDTPDQSGNQWVVGLFGLGEGWHNNHHAFPESAFHGLRWYEIDLSGYVIRAMERAHLITGVRRVSTERLHKRRVA